jgi:hypothetical protein
VAGTGGRVLDIILNSPAMGDQQHVDVLLPEQCMFGNPLTEAVRWYGSDPTYLVGNLSDLSLFVASGNGLPGVYDNLDSSTGVEDAIGDGAIEAFVHAMNQAFSAALDAAGNSSTEYCYGNGTHRWPYWLRDLAHFLPQMSATFAKPQTVTPFNYRTVDAQFSMFGYQFSINHVAEEFTYLSNVSSSGMSVVGDGELSVTTPGNYSPGKLSSVTTRSSSLTDGTRVLTQNVRADSTGQLRFDVNLGSPSPVRQLVFLTNLASFMDSAAVSILPS